MRVVFMGTPEFAVPGLAALVKSGHDIAGVVTNPDARRGRGLALAPSPVKMEARKHGLPVFEAASTRHPGLARQMTQWSPDLTVVVAFRILPLNIINIAPLGTVNIHASLLPKYRGAAPIQWAIAAGETQTGVTLFFLNEQVDAGDIIAQEAIPIGPSETAGLLYERLKQLGAEILIRHLDDLASGRVKTRRQNTQKATPAPKIRKEHGRIDWTLPARDIYNRLRAFTPFPGLFTCWNGLRLHIVQGRSLDLNTGKTPGQLVHADPGNGISVQTGCGAFQIETLKPQNKKAMNARAFINGWKISEHDRFD